ncbi:MAG: stimulus-sensing domain-containing protein [Hyphomicrobium sp.]|jgi:two-component system sensor histidine kinase ChvG
MALDTERTTAAGSFERVQAAASRFAKAAASASATLFSVARKAAVYVGRWMLSMWLVRFVTAGLLRRIMVANLAGVVIVVGGILYFGQYNAWLIDAKRESLKVQGEMIAAAIAGDARVETGRLVIHTDSLPSAGNEPAVHDDGFPSIGLSIRPERVAPILRRLIQPTTRRARVYSLDGTLLVDSANLLTRGQLSRQEPKVAAGTKMRTKNFYTRLLAWMIDEELPVYKEIGNANGTLYPEVRQAIQGQTTAMLLLNDTGEQIVSTAVPIKRASAVQGVLLMSTPPGEIDQILSEERTIIWSLASVALIAALVSSWLLARTVADPMRRLSAAADLVSRNINARHELPVYAERHDEVGQMARAFSSMTAALYRRAEASESFAADVAHELKNPLTAARSIAESLSYAKTDAQRSELVQQIQNELKRLNRLITDVSNASRLDAELARQHMGPIDVTGVVMSVAQIFRDILSSDTRRVITVIDPAPYENAFLVNGDAGRLGQVLTNLVDNAVSFSPEGRTVTLRVSRSGQTVEFHVDDEGPGIPEDRLNIIFDRFYTDRPATEALRGKNSGLGLSISREIVRAHGGDINAQNRRRAGESEAAKPIGARFIVRLPALVHAARQGGTSARRA